MNILLLENTQFSAGAVYENHLIYGGVGGIINEMVLNESTDANFGKLLRFRGKFQEADAVNKNKRSYPMSVLQTNVDRLADTMTEGGLIGELDHPCLSSSDFQVLTPKGFKEFKEIRIGDEVYSRIGGKLVTSKVKGIVDKPYDGKVYHFKGKSIDCEFTPDHKTLLLGRQDNPNKRHLQFYKTAEEIHNNRKNYNKCVIPKTAEWQGLQESLITIPAYEGYSKKDVSKPLVFETKKFMAFLGLYLAEGFLNNGINICQKTSYGKELIKSFLDDLHPELTWTEQKTGFYTGDHRLKQFLLQFGSNCYDKKIPTQFKQYASEYLEEMLLWYAVGDGRMQIQNEDCSYKKNGKENILVKEVIYNEFDRINVFTTSKDLINDLHECLIKTGRCGTISEVISKEDYKFDNHVIKAENKRPLYQLNFSKTKNIHLDSRFLHITEKHHIGNVYCLITEYGNFYMRHKGKSFWTGNCDSIVHFKDASHKIVKLWWEGTSLMGEGVILPTPMGKILKSLIESGVRIGISSRGVGNGKVNEDGILVIGESYKLITFDAVADPSTYYAFQKKVSGKHENYENSIVKNESSSIDKVTNPKLLLACLGGIISQQANKLKRG